jgi:hypothetical protein
MLFEIVPLPGRPEQQEGRRRQGSSTGRSGPGDLQSHGQSAVPSRSPSMSAARETAMEKRDGAGRGTPLCCRMP